MKGSTVDRKTKGKTKPSTTLKDLDFMLVSNDRRRHGKQLVDVSAKDRKKLMSAIRKDVELFRSLGLMDYSLLIVIERKSLLRVDKRFSESINQLEQDD